MFFDKQSEDDFFFSLDRELKKQHAFDSDLKTARRAQLQEHLKSAAESLRHAGLTKEAQMVAHVYKINEAEQNLSAEQVVAALESFGWDYSADTHNAEDCADADCDMCQDDNGLTKKELAGVRKMLAAEGDEDSDDAKDDMDDDSFKGLKAMFDAMDKDEQERFKREVLD